MKILLATPTNLSSQVRMSSMKSTQVLPLQRIPKEEVAVFRGDNKGGCE